MLQYIIDAQNREYAVETALEVLANGCKWIELKASPELSDEEVTKIFEEISPRCKEAEAYLIIADRVELAKKLEADGVHLYRNDLPVSAARVTLEAAPIIVVSIDGAEAAKTLRGYDIDVLYYAPENTADDGYIDEIKRIADVLKELEMEQPIVVGGNFDAEEWRKILDAGANGAALLSTDTTPADYKKTAIALHTN